MDKILVIGAGGQLGTELVVALRQKYGSENVVASDIRPKTNQLDPYIQLDACNSDSLNDAVSKFQINQIYHLAAILSAKGEQNPLMAWELNMRSLLNVLELGKKQIKKIYWPSSIAVFGNDTPKQNTPQFTVMNPSTVYGISKLAGERWCAYYHQKYNVDVRSLRYPGLIGYKSLPGGGTTDYAVDIFWKAINGEKFGCFLNENTMLPMMYMDDAIKATLDLMEAPAENINIRSSYNISGMSFTPKMIYEEIKRYYPDFKISYESDYRQQIADSWPGSINDDQARDDWGWKPQFDLRRMAKLMLDNITLINV